MRTAKARVRLYRTVVIPSEFPAAAANLKLDPLPDSIEATSKRELEGLTAAYADVAREVVVEPSPSAWRAILAAADDFEADLIVLGSHGYDVHVVHRGSEHAE